MNSIIPPFFAALILACFHGFVLHDYDHAHLYVAVALVILAIRATLSAAATNPLGAAPSAAGSASTAQHPEHMLAPKESRDV